MAQLAPPEKKMPPLQASAFAGPLQTERAFDRLIVKFKDEAVTRSSVFDFNAARNQVSELESGKVLKSIGTGAAKLAYLKSISAQTHVVVAGQKLSRAELFALAKQIEQDPRVAYAEIDEMVHAMFTPNDPSYLGQQWHYQGPTSFAGGANLPAAWDRSTGSGVVVAVIDTGVRPHADLAANLLPGYDFISDLTIANDGDGRDGNAADPGNSNLAGACGTGSPANASNWHGTHVAGTVAAVTNNGIGVSGAAFGAKVLPVRVLGVCGGYVSDMAAGMLWAAGFSVPGVPANPHKAKVLNMSLGGSGSCSLTTQNAVNAVRSTGSVVVAATGNDRQIGIGQPANCAGVVAVTAHTKLGDNADYANIGPGTTISGPGGGKGVLIPGDGAPVYSILNTGTSAPLADSYAGYEGTSMATPHVAGVAALLASLQPSITPNALSAVLSDSARAHPAGTYCASIPVSSICGAGLLDANAAIDRLNSLVPTVSASPSQPGLQRAGSTVVVNAAASANSGGNATFSYQWTQLAGPAVHLSNAAGASTSFVALAVGASYTLKVQVTDGAGLVASNQVSVSSNAAPVMDLIPAQSVVQGGSLSFTASATDAENNPIVFVATGLPAGSSFDAATGVFTWNAADPVSNYEVLIAPHDGSFSGTPQTVSIAVTAPGGGSSGGGGGSIGWIDLIALLSLTALGVFFGSRQGTQR